MAASWRGDDVTGADVRDEVRSFPEVKTALDRIWPVLTPAQLLHDLFGSTGLLRLAAGGVLEDFEYKSLHRPRCEAVDDVRWTPADVALFDDAREVLGPKIGKNGKPNEADEIRTYGHIVIDEVQDLTPMQLKMAARRSLSGSMTVVGDIAQATGALAPDDWSDVLAHLPDQKPGRVIGLSVGYRIPAQIMELANRVMAAATPGLRAPTSVRLGDVGPRVVRVESLVDGVVEEVRQLQLELPAGSVAVVAPDERCDAISDALSAAGVEHGRAATTGLDQSLTVVPVSVVKGLELDAVVVVEPSEIVNATEHGMRSLYVALTRSTQRLSVVHHDDLPEPLQD
jgi:DNA helicase IV